MPAESEGKRSFLSPSPSKSKSSKRISSPLSSPPPAASAGMRYSSYGEKSSSAPSSPSSPGSGSEGGGMAMSAMSLPEFLAEAELSHYHSALRNELKVTCVEHLKYVKEEDLEGIGMTRPEMRRLKKFYKREHPQGTFGKLKRAIMRSGTTAEASTRSLSPSPPEHRISRPISAVVRPQGKQLIPVDAISLSKTLGEGHFGLVQQGLWTTESGEKMQVAIKSLRKEKMQNGAQDFLKEAAIMQAVDHDNIVRLYGVVLDNQDTVMLVTELAPMRSLVECLKEPGLRPDLPVPRLCDFAQQVCDGMSYLESKRLVHRDLAASNILVFSKSKVKISDFGVSRAVGVGQEYYQSNYGANVKLPMAWCAPECINSMQFTSASDIWSYGVALWEVFTYGFQPWAGLNGQQILEAVDEPQCQRLDQPDLCPKEYYAILQKCWEHNPDRRPTFSQLFLTLPQIRPIQVKAVKDYPAPTVEKDYLYYKNYDIIIVLDKSPSNAPAPGLWKGCLASGKFGFFNPTNTVPFVEPKTSPIALPKTTLTRKESGRNSKRSKLRTDMIGAPQNDLRHTGHIGYDGAVFGDVSFIGDNYDKLPVKVGASGKVDVSRGSSLSSIPRNTDSPDRNGYVKTSNSEDALDRHNGYGHSWISQESLASTQADDHHDGFMDMEDNSIFADFKMPDLSSSFDLGPSFMDEVLKALDEKEKQAEAASSPSFNGRDFGDDIDPNRVDLEAKTPTMEEKTPVVEEKGFSSYNAPSKRVSPPPLPVQPPRVDTLREKKQAKVKPMSASEEKMMEDAITLANEVNATRAARHSQSQSPPQSPTGSEKVPVEFPDTAADPSPSLISKLKNSIRRSPKSDRKRTFSDDLPSKGDVEEELPPGAQEAYNALVVKGADRHSTRDDQEPAAERVSVSNDAVFACGDSLDQSEHQGGGFRLSSSSSSSKTPPSLPQAPPRPMPKPRLDPKKSELPVPKPRPEIVQRVEPTIRKPPDSPDFPPVKDKESHIPVVSSSRKESLSESKEREREQLKRTIEIVRMESPPPRDDPQPSVTATASLVSGPTTDLDAKESTPEPDSDSTRRSSASEGAESSSSASKVLSLFDDDFNEPSPREIMSKLARESRMRRNLDHQRVLSGENQDSQAASMARARREPTGIPVKSSGPPAQAPMAAAEEGEKGEEEVDTNPLRMLRGGAIPIRTSRGAGNSMTAKSSSSSTTSALRYPKFGFHSASVGGVGGGGGGDGGEDTAADTAAPKLPPRAQSVSSTKSGGGREEEAAPSVPPRTPLRQHSMPALNSRPRERRNPLINSKNCDATNTTTSASPFPQGSDGANTPPSPSHHPPPLMSRSCGGGSSFSASFDASSLALASSSSPSRGQPHHLAFSRSVSVHDEPCPADLPQAPSRPRPQPLSLSMRGERSDVASHHYYGVDESALDGGSTDDVFYPSSSSVPSTRRSLPPVPDSLGVSRPGTNSPSGSRDQFLLASSSPSGLAVGGGTTSRGLVGRVGGGGVGGRKFAPTTSVKCSLEQLGFYNQHDPFWVQSVQLPERTYSLDTTQSSEEVSPLLLVNYKNSDNVSYEDLLDFGLDRQKNGEEVETLQKILDNEVSYEECRTALDETRWDMGQAVKYVRLKQLLSLRLADVHTCKRALMATAWDVHRAADSLLSQNASAGHPSTSLGHVHPDPSSPESLEV